MILSNILHRPARTIISILAVAIEVGMVMLVVGMTTGLVNDTARRQEGVGADILVQPPGSSYFFGLSNAPMPIKIGDRLADLPHVLAVTPALFQFNTTGGINLVYGIDMQSFDRVTGGFAYHEGGPLAGPDDILVDDLFAHAHHLSVGKRLNVLNHDFKVAGVVEHGKGGRLFITLTTLQDLMGAHDKASIFYVKCTDPGYADDVKEEVHSLLPTYRSLSLKEYMSLMTSSNLPALNTFVTAMIAVAVAIGFLVIFLSMYTTITERTREIGILKSLGSSKGYIIDIILREAGLLSLIGIMAGYGGTLLAQRVMKASFPTLPVDLSVSWALWAALLALGGSLLGAFYPALRASQLDPVDALAYE
jgi:putative ABC transport system permease protein